MSGEAWRRTAPAKINLALRVTGKRADGYHTLQTIFRLIDLSDELRFEKTNDGEIRLDCVGARVGVEPERNLAWMAARALRDEAAKLGRKDAQNWGCRIELNKRIFQGAGLGGGSSDAAAVLTALNALWGAGFSADRLAELALGLGADAPFFLFGRDAYAQGVGERLEPIELPDAAYLLLYPNVEADTKAVFSHPLLTDKENAGSISRLALVESALNDLLQPASALYPPIRRALDVLGACAQEADGRRARMTGSGSCVFLSFSADAQSGDGGGDAVGIERALRLAHAAADQARAMLRAEDGSADWRLAVARALPRGMGSSGA